MFNETSAVNGNGTYVKVPAYPGLYRHSRSGRYYGFKKLRGQRKECSLQTTDRKIAERRRASWSEIEPQCPEQYVDDVVLLRDTSSRLRDRKGLIRPISVEFRIKVTGVLFRSQNVEGMICAICGPVSRNP